MTTSRLWPRPRPSSPSEFRSRRLIQLRKPPAPPGGKTPPSAGPSRLAGQNPAWDGGRRIDLARSLAPGYNFLGANGDSDPADPSEWIESASSGQVVMSQTGLSRARLSQITSSRI